MNRTGTSISKAQLAEMYGLSSHCIWVLMNKDYYEELTAVGYRKTMRLLPPIIVRKFFEVYGEPFIYEDK